MPVTIDYRVKTDQYEHHTAWLDSGRRDIPGLTWGDVLRILHEFHDLPVKFFTVDFLTTMLFTVDDTDAELTAAFCSQGRRRGEVLLSIPAATPDAAAIMQRLGDAIEQRQAEIRQWAIAHGIPAHYYAALPKDEDEEYNDLQF
jgi:hypothetical protein